MGFCILGGKENFLRKTISDKLTSLGWLTNIGATPATYSNNIQSIYDTRYTDGQDSVKTSRKLTLTSSQTGSNVDITDNWYTTCDASAVYSAGQTAGASAARQGNAADADVRSGKTYTNSTSSGRTGSMPNLTSSNFAGTFSSTSAGANSNYNVASLSAGYVPNGTTVLSTAAGTSATINTTSNTGVQTINCIPGIYNKIQVNQTYAYKAGIDNVINNSEVYDSGSIDANASKTINVAAAAWIFVQGLGYNSRGVYKRVGSNVTIITQTDTTCTATASSIVLTNNNSGGYAANYWVITMPGM